MSGAYSRARKAFESLEAIVELTDQVDLDCRREELMRNPTRALAADMYVSGIRMWLEEHGDNHAENPSVQKIMEQFA